MMYSYMKYAFDSIIAGQNMSRFGFDRNFVFVQLIRLRSSPLHMVIAGHLRLQVAKESPFWIPNFLAS